MAQPPSLDQGAAGPGTSVQRRTLVLSLLACGCMLAALLWAGRGQLDSHRDRWFGPAGADLALRYAALAPAMDEAALQRHMAGAALVCADAAAGERHCQARLSRADGVAASRVQAVLAEGRLRTVTVWVPWWEHHSTARSLVATLGAPTSHANATAASADLGSIAWEMPGGTVRIARQPGWNPWHWSQLLWTAREPA